PATLVNREHDVSYLVAAFGDRPLGDFTTKAQARQLRDELYGFGLALSTTKNLLAFGRELLKFAVDEGWLAVNVLASQKPKSVPRSEKRAMTPEEAGRLFRYCLSDDAAPQPEEGSWHVPAANLVAFALLTTKRLPSEIAALREEDVALERRLYTINQVYDKALRAAKPADPTGGGRKA